MSLNQIILIGRMGKDPELRTTSTGKNIANFSLAVNRRMKNQDGEFDTDWFNIKVWGTSADYVNNYLSKGRNVCVQGRIEFRKYTDKNGKEQSICEVVADNVIALDRPKDDSNSGGNSYSKPQSSKSQKPVDDYDPFEDF